MQFKISGRHIEITDAIREYAKTKTDKLHRYYDRIQEIVVVVDKRDRIFEAEIIVDVEHHAPIVARDKNEDLYASIDGSADKAERQLRDLKEKLRDHKH